MMSVVRLSPLAAVKTLDPKVFMSEEIDLQFKVTVKRPRWVAFPDPSHAQTIGELDLGDFHSWMEQRKGTSFSAAASPATAAVRSSAVICR